MSEEIKAEAEAPRRGGWPKGRPRKAAPVEEAPAVPETPKASPKMKAKPNWSDDTWANVGADMADKLSIPRDIVESIHREGFALQWVTRSVRGMEAPLELAKYTKGGWTPVHQSDFDGVLDGIFMSKGLDEVIVLEDCMLVARPLALHQKAATAMKRDAGAPVQVAESQLGHGVHGVTGADHPTALRGNSIRKTVVQIPD